MQAGHLFERLKTRATKTAPQTWQVLSSSSGAVCFLVMSVVEFAPTIQPLVYVWLCGLAFWTVLNYTVFSKARAHAPAAAKSRQLKAVFLW